MEQQQQAEDRIDCRENAAYGLACVVYLATEAFARRVAEGGEKAAVAARTICAARSARQKIAEFHNAASQGEPGRRLRVLLAEEAMRDMREVAGDLEAFIVGGGEAPWSEEDPKFKKAFAITYDDFSAEGDRRHAFGNHILEMRRRFAAALENEDAVIAANAILVTADRVLTMLGRQHDRLAEELAKAKEKRAARDERKPRDDDRPAPAKPWRSGYGDRDHGGRGNFGGRDGYRQERRPWHRDGDDGDGDGYGERGGWRGKGGFRQERRPWRRDNDGGDDAAGEAPSCPQCGGPMRLVTAKKGPNAGNRFWSCRDFPDCKGSLRYEE